jgi:DNA-binding transcriptional ArsR family regulator
MESVRFHSLNLRLEAAAALTRMAYRGDSPRSGDLSNAVDYYCRKYALDRTRFSGMLEAYEYVKDRFVCEETELLTLFGISEGFETNLYDLMNQLWFNLGPERVGDLNLRIAVFLSDEDDEPHFDHAGVPDLLAYAQRMPAPDAVKFHFTDMVVRYEEYLARANLLLDQAEALLREKAGLLEPYARQAADQWAAMPDEDAFFNRLADEGLRLDCRNADVYPQVIQFTTVALHSNVICVSQFGEEEHTVIAYGFMVDELSLSKRSGKTDLESIYSLLHALDDKKRLQILTALRERPLYGQELAALAELSPATISHHMSELVSVGLVTIEKQGVKLLYNLNEARIAEFSAMLGKNLLR